MKKLLLGLTVLGLIGSAMAGHHSTVSNDAPNDPSVDAPSNQPSEDVGPGSKGVPSLPDAASGIAKSVTDTVNNFLGSTGQGLGDALQALLGGNQTETPQ